MVYVPHCLSNIEMKLSISIIFVFFAFKMLDSGQGAKIVFMPSMIKSHVASICRTGLELSQKGHDLYAVINSVFLPKVSHSLETWNIKPLVYSPKIGDKIMRGQDVINNFVRVSFSHGSQSKEYFDLFTSFTGLREGTMAECEDIMESPELIEKIRALKPDLFIVDAWPLAPCLFLLPYSMDLPYITIVTHISSIAPAVPNPLLPSFVPNLIFGDLEVKMNFIQRLKNTIYYLVPMVKGLGQHASLIERFVPNKAAKTYNDIISKSELFFIEQDPAMNYIFPTMPNVICVGGLLSTPPRPIPTDLEEFVSSAKNGVVVVTFGSLAEDIPMTFLIKLANVFNQLEYSFIWNTVGKKVPNLKDNILASAWIPQNDLLGHPNVKLFITHCGNNGMFEAVYNAVPMIGLPIYADQPFNCRHLQRRGFGICLDLRSFTEDELSNSITSIISNNTYKNTIKVNSNILKSRDPRKRMVNWIEYVLRFGGSHIRSPAVDMPFYQFLLIDVFAFIFLTILIIILFACILLYTVLRLCRGLTGTKSKLKRS